MASYFILGETHQLLSVRGPGSPTLIYRMDCASSFHGVETLAVPVKTMTESAQMVRMKMIAHY